MNRLALVIAVAMLALPASAQAHARAGGVSFYARVVRSSPRGLTLRLGDGRTVSYAAAQVSRAQSGAGAPDGPLAHAARAELTVDIQGLQPGVTVIVTKLEARGRVAIELPGPGAPAIAGEQQATGLMSGVHQSTFELVANGSELHMTSAPGALRGRSSCETATVSYHQDAGLLIADRVKLARGSAAGACARRDTRDAIGTITRVSATHLTIRTEGHRSLRFSLGSPAGFELGAVVDVTYRRAGRGALDVRQIEYVEQQTTGTVAAVAPDAITIVDGATGHRRTFTSEPAQSMFAAVAAGDHLDLVYHRSSGALVADVVDDQAAA